MSAHFDLQPAIAARRAASTDSRLLLAQMKRPVINARRWPNGNANARKPNLERTAAALHATVQVSGGGAHFDGSRMERVTKDNDGRGFAVCGAPQTGSDTCSAYRTFDIHSDPRVVWLRHRTREEPFVRQWPGERVVDLPRNGKQTRDSHLIPSAMFPVAKDCISRPSPLPDPRAQVQRQTRSRLQVAARFPV